MIISVGGEKGARRRQRRRLREGLRRLASYALMDEYGFDGVDIDLENGLNSTYMTQALKSAAAKAGRRRRDDGAADHRHAVARRTSTSRRR